MAKVIAIANQKGGVGKTTTCVNLSSCVAALGKKVLVVDLDPQGNTTSGYGVAKKGQQSNIYTCLINDDDVRQAIVHTKFNADLIASNTQLAGAVVELVELPRRENRLRSILAPLIPLYDYVFIDCPPSLDLLTINGVDASFVAVAKNDGVNISARSMGALNVQVILEPLGGGGHLMMAGAQLQNCTLQDAEHRIREQIDLYRAAQKENTAR